MTFLEEMKQKAKNNKQTIVLPETYDERMIEASDEILKEDLANLILVGDEAEIKGKHPQFDLSKAIFINPKTYERKDELIDTLVELRKAKGMTKEEATKLITENELYFAVMLVKMDIADGMVAGAANTTADVLRPSLQILKTAKGTKIVSSFFLMVVPDCEFGNNGIFAFADCGLNQHPTAEELACIALDTGKTYKSLVHDEPRVALLSHSSMGSAKHADVDKVVEATRIAKENANGMLVDGELQLDAAIVPEIGAQKAPGSQVAGKANVLVFPTLDAGNIGYKLVQRLAKAEAYGPMTQGISKPVNDLSRGCSYHDIVGVVAITAVQCQSQKN